MIDKKSFASMREQVERFDRLREDVIKLSRDILKLSKGAIYSVHRNEIKTAKQQLADAKSVIKKIDSLIAKDVHLAAVGPYLEALEEYVEASCYLSFVVEKKIPMPKELGVDVDTYLPGLCDLIGEITRKAVNDSIKGDYQSAIHIRDIVSEIYAEFMLFDFRNIPVRRKFDSMKYSLEKLENLILELKLKGKLQ